MSMRLVIASMRVVSVLMRAVSAVPVPVLVCAVLVWALLWAASALG
ncbi:hypothetical protein [Micromonospora zamorensis]